MISPLGKDWVSRFLQRNQQLKSQIAKSIEQARKAVTKEQILQWFEVFNHEIQENGVRTENIYNMDETGWYHECRTLT